MNAYRPWRVEHLELDGPLMPLVARPGVSGHYLVYWWHGIPLGLAVVHGTELPLSATALRDIGAESVAPALRAHLGVGEPGDVERTPLAALDGLLAARGARMADVTASVVICTRARPDMLERCLGSLAGSLAAGDEVVVVDQAPQQAAEAREVVARYPGVRHVLEPGSGLNAARNAGIRATTGSIVAFLADDLRAGPQWLARMKGAFAEPDVGAVTGLILKEWFPAEAEQPFGTRRGVNRGFVPRQFGSDYFAAHRGRGVPAWEIGAGASMAVRREALAALGGFEERLDLDASGCGADAEMWYRILGAGKSCRYEPSAAAFWQRRDELPEPSALSYEAFRGHTAALLMQFERSRDRGNLHRLLLGLPGYLAGRLLRLPLQDRGERALVAAEMRGWVAGIAYYLGQPRRSPPEVAPAAATMPEDRDA